MPTPARNRTLLAKLRAHLRSMRRRGTLDDLTWLIDDQVAACTYPASRTLGEFASQGIAVIVNLHKRPHEAHLIDRHGLTQIHLPVRDFTSPTPDQLAAGVAAIDRALAEGQGVAIHCASGRGRTGTLLACWLVSRGATPDDAIARVRAARPGSVETASQIAAVHTFGLGRTT